MSGGLPPISTLKEQVAAKSASNGSSINNTPSMFSSASIYEEGNGCPRHEKGKNLLCNKECKAEYTVSYDIGPFRTEKDLFESIKTEDLFPVLEGTVIPERYVMERRSSERPSVQRGPVVSIADSPMTPTKYQQSRSTMPPPSGPPACRVASSSNNLSSSAGGGSSFYTVLSGGVSDHGAVSGRYRVQGPGNPLYHDRTEHQSTSANESGLHSILASKPSAHAEYTTATSLGGGSSTQTTFSNFNVPASVYHHQQQHTHTYLAPLGDHQNEPLFTAASPMATTIESSNLSAQTLLQADKSSPSPPLQHKRVRGKGLPLYQTMSRALASPVVPAVATEYIIPISQSQHYSEKRLETFPEKPQIQSKAARRRRKQKENKQKEWTEKENQDLQKSITEEKKEEEVSEQVPQEISQVATTSSSKKNSPSVEEHRMLLKREKNRQAAKRCREKKAVQLHILSECDSYMNDLNKRLLRAVQFMEKVNDFQEKITQRKQNGVPIDDLPILEVPEGVFDTSFLHRIPRTDESGQREILRKLAAVAAASNSHVGSGHSNNDGKNKNTEDEDEDVGMESVPDESQEEEERN